jgi:hypothetical protein
MRGEDDRSVHNSWDDGVPSVIVKKLPGTREQSRGFMPSLEAVR